MESENHPLSDQRVPLPTKLAYGSGGFAFGIKENCFTAFLLLFYNQVHGMPAWQVSLAIALALVVDAIIDPIVGYMSDRTKSRWGRRHPWFYYSAIPLGLAWLMLWNPPEWHGPALLAWLFLSAVAVRALVSCNEVPGLALAAEMTRDYHERTMVLRYRFLFAWVGGLFMLWLSFSVLLPPSSAYPEGQFDPSNYPVFSIVGALMMVGVILLSALGTHRRYARPLPHNPDIEDHSFSHLVETVKIRPFLMLMLAALFAFASQGIVLAMGSYILPYYWGFTNTDFQLYALAILLGVAAAFAIMPIISKRMDKGKAASMFALVSLGVGILPYILRFAGLFPAVGNPAMVPAYLILSGISIGSGAATIMLTSSMMGDVADWSEERTGQRREGLFYSGYFFIQKCVTALGIFATGQILSAVGFPENAKPGHVSPEIVDRLVVVFLCVIVVLGVLASRTYLRFPIGQAEHEETLRRLAVRAGKIDG